MSRLCMLLPLIALGCGTWTSEQQIRARGYRSLNWDGAWATAVARIYREGGGRMESGEVELRVIIHHYLDDCADCEVQIVARDPEDSVLGAITTTPGESATLAIPLPSLLADCFETACRSSLEIDLRQESEGFVDVEIAAYHQVAGVGREPSGGLSFFAEWVE